MMLVFAAWAAMASGAVAPPTGGRCIELDRIIRRLVIAPDQIEFETVGGRVLRNRLVAACPGIEELDRFRVIQFDARDGRRMCAGDRFRVVDQQVAAQGGSASSPWCRFGRFEPRER